MRIECMRIKWAIRLSLAVLCGAVIFNGAQAQPMRRPTESKRTVKVLS